MAYGFPRYAADDNPADFACLAAFSESCCTDISLIYSRPTSLWGVLFEFLSMVVIIFWYYCIRCVDTVTYNGIMTVVRSN